MATAIFVASDADLSRVVRNHVGELITRKRTADVSCLVNSKALLYFEAFKVCTHTHTHTHSHQLCCMYKVLVTQSCLTLTTPWAVAC